MRKNEYNELAMESLANVFGCLQQYAANCIRDKNRKRRRKKTTAFSYSRSVIQEKHGSYSFIPNSIHAVLPRLIHAYDYLKLKKKHKRYGFTFLDAGCGYGNIMMLASGVGFSVYGLELDPVTIEFAKGVNDHWRNIKRQDILTYNDYKKFDVIYYYCPFFSTKEIEFEKRVEKQ